MYQVHATIWNAIARTQTLSNPSLRQLFAMDQDALTQALDAQAQALEASGVPNRVIVAYQTMAPLLAESEAISAYIVQTDNWSLRQALPEVLSAEEAVAIANLDRPMSSSEQRRLLDLLLPLTPPSWLDD
ncbi:hypothetical protein [Crenobacter cavernae]|uniref:Uncharacterized protein n=1 Tax=Crenobacter cavernae TaxID=2290923 RepID=A0A345Y7R1_9NEIS|nr:hypothetical protein [Crenobacter cavernae]AXK39963.1 hypothetical protein DWG20_11220 [Crenobacter cavernae]